jgi:nucleotide-binding universal stress UspA family protein
MEDNENTTQGFQVMPLKKVLIALDYDPTSLKVAESGYSLASAMNARTVLLHIIAEEIYYSSLEYSPVTGFGGFSNADFSLMASSEGLSKASEYFLETVKAHLGNPEIEIMIDQGDFSDMILKTAKNINADLIVMGSHSRRGLEKILMGSVTEKVLHHTTIPLFIIPTKGSLMK